MLDVNGRAYALPRAETVGGCGDGCEPDYLGQAVGAGEMGGMKRRLAEGRGLGGNGVVRG